VQRADVVALCGEVSAAAQHSPASLALKPTEWPPAVAVDIFSLSYDSLLAEARPSWDSLSDLLSLLCPGLDLVTGPMSELRLPEAFDAPLLAEAKRLL